MSAVGTATALGDGGAGGGQGPGAARRWQLLSPVPAGGAGGSRVCSATPVQGLCPPRGCWGLPPPHPPSTGSPGRLVWRKGCAASPGAAVPLHRSRGRRTIPPVPPVSL